MCLDLQKNRSQKLSMLEKNKDIFRICIKFRTKLWRDIFDFRFIFLMKQGNKKKVVSKNNEKGKKENWKCLFINFAWNSI